MNSTKMLINCLKCLWKEEGGGRRKEEGGGRRGEREDRGKSEKDEDGRH